MTTPYLSLSILKESNNLSTLNIGVNINSIPTNNVIRYVFDTLAVENCSMNDIQSIKGQYNYDNLDSIKDNIIKYLIIHNADNYEECIDKYNLDPTDYIVCSVKYNNKIFFNKYIDRIDKNKYLNILRDLSSFNIYSNLTSKPSGTITALPPSLVAQYHFTDLGAVKPYIGAGVNYTIFGNTANFGNINNALVVNNSSVGFVGQVGVDYMLDKNLGINLDLKYVTMKADVNYSAANGGASVGKLTLNPLIPAVGVTYKF